MKLTRKIEVIGEKPVAVPLGPLTVYDVRSLQVLLLLLKHLCL